MEEIHRSQVRIASCIDGHLHRHDTTTPRIMNGITKLVELLIIDEAERLTPAALEVLRDNHDRTHIGMGRSLDPDDFTDAQAIAAIERITRGNFRLLKRLFPQITRVLKINQLETITDDVMEAAASTLVIGS